MGGETLRVTVQQRTWRTLEVIDVNLVDAMLLFNLFLTVYVVMVWLSRMGK